MEGITDDQITNSICKLYLALHINLLETAGMWPVRKFSKSWLNYVASFCLFVSISCQVLVLLSEQGYLIQPSSNPLEAVSYIGTACLRIEAVSNPLEAVSYIGTACLRIEAVSKLLYMLIIRKKIERLLKSLEFCFKLSTRDEMPYNNENVKSIMTIWSRGSKFVALGWTGLCVLAGTQWALVPFGINKDVTVAAQNEDDQRLGNLTANSSTDLHLETFAVRVLPLRGWFPFNATACPVYEVVFLIQGIGNITFALAVGVFDQFYCAMLLLICGQFECLKMALRNIRTSKNSRTDRENISMTGSEITLRGEEIRGGGRNKHDERVTLNCVHDNLAKSKDKENRFEGYEGIPEPGGGTKIPNVNESSSRLCLCRNEIEDELTSCIRHHQSLVKYVFCMKLISKSVGLCFINQD
jgi:hypothetical protein